jgi:uncharacterized membrane protein
VSVRSATTVRVATPVVPLTLAALAIAAPLLSTSPLVSLAIRKFFSIVCHQDPARSFSIHGAPVAVCVRCLGIYLGAALGAASSSAGPALRDRQAWASRPRLLAALAITAALNTLDVAAEWTNLHGNLPTLRFTLGLALGAAIGVLVAHWTAESAALNLRRAASLPL